MAMIKREVTGSAENMKLVRNSKQAPKAAKGSTQRTSFEGSRDTRAAGAIGPNMVLRSSPGYVDQGDVTVGDTSHSRSFTTTGSRVTSSPAVTVAREDVTKGMGGRVIKGMK